MTKAQKFYLNILEVSMIESKREFDKVAEDYKNKKATKSEYYKAYSNYRFDADAFENYKNKLVD